MSEENTTETVDSSTNEDQQKDVASRVESIKREWELGSYVDAVFAFCDENNIEIDIVPKLLNKSLKDKLELEAMEMNLLPRTGALPI